MAADEPKLLARVRRVGAVVLVAAAAFIGMASATCAYRFMRGPEEEGEGVTVRPTPDVVVAMRDLARLESAEFHMERVIDLRDRQQRMFGLVEAEDAILLVAAGDVTAGVDLTQMGPGDVVADVERRSVRIVLPPPQVLSTRLDNERTFVHTRRTDVLARRNEELETRARQEAERTLHDAAVQAGILDRARRNAEQTVTLLVRSLGYEDVRVGWHPG